MLLFVTVDSVRSLTGGGEAQHSTPGIVIAALSLAIMPVLSWLQRRAGRELGSKTAVADSKQTLLCTYLSAVLLVGLVLNSTLGWWWATPARPWSSPESPSVKASTPGEAMSAAPSRTPRPTTTANPMIAARAADPVPHRKLLPLPCHDGTAQPGDPAR